MNPRDRSPSAARSPSPARCAERLASVWPPDEAQRRPIGWRTVAARGWSAAWRPRRSSRAPQLPWWATGGLPGAPRPAARPDRHRPRAAPAAAPRPRPAHRAGRPLRALQPRRRSADGASSAPPRPSASSGALALVVRGGLALGDLYLVAPIGLMLGWPAIFTALFAAAFLCGRRRASSCWPRDGSGCAATSRSARSWSRGAVIALLFDERLLTRRSLRRPAIRPASLGCYPSRDASGSPASAPSSDDDAPHHAPRLAAPRPGDVPAHHPWRLRADVRRLDPRHGRRHVRRLQLLRLRPARPESARRHRAARVHLRLRPHRPEAPGALRVPEPRGGDVRELPEVVWQATVASEDRTFWENNGVDFQGIVRAALANLEAGEIVQGASTITQQVIDYARVLRPRRARRRRSSRAPRPRRASSRSTPTRPPPTRSAEAETDVCQPPAPNNSTDIEDKIRENILAMQVTAAYPGRAGKEQILETYLNLIYYGNGSYGIKAAAANYFGLSRPGRAVHRAGRLPGRTAPGAIRSSTRTRTRTPTPRTRRPAPPTRCASATSCSAPCSTRATSRPREEREARNTTWLEMDAEPPHQRPARAALQLPRSQRGRAHPRHAAGVTDPRPGGPDRRLPDHDHARLPLQQVATSWSQKWVANLADKNVNNAALVAIDSATGEIVAYVGSVDYYNREAPARCRASSTSPASAFGSQARPSSRSRTRRPSSRATRRSPRCSSTPSPSSGPPRRPRYRPTNADIKEHGPVLAIDALRYSMNIPSVQMQFLVGSQTTAEFAESLGIASAEYIMGQDPGPVAGARVGAGQPDEHDPGLLRRSRSRASSTRPRRSSRSATATAGSSTPARTTGRASPTR